MAPAPENSRTSVFVLVLVSPLPDISNQVHNTERTGPLRVTSDIGRRAQGSSRVGSWSGTRIPCVSPRVSAVVRSLSRVLPFPFVWKPRPSPRRIRASVFQRHPRHGLRIPTVRISTVLPIAQKIVVVLGLIVCRIQELFVVGVRNRIAIDVKGLHLH